MRKRIIRLRDGALDGKSVPLSTGPSKSRVYSLDLIKRIIQTSCIICPDGRKPKNAGRAACSPCSPGTHRLGAAADAACRSCPAGWAQEEQDQNSCTQCARGETTSAGAASCGPCDLGMFGHALGRCSVCLAGQFQDGKGETSCIPCPVDTFYPNRAATSRSQCEACPDDRTTGALTGRRNASACVCRRGDYYADDQGACIPCPDGAVCPVDGSTVSQLHAGLGFWQPENATDEFLACASAFSDRARGEAARLRCCPDAANCSAVPRPHEWTPDAQCTKGYAGPLCLACADQHVLYEGDCIPCDGESPLWIGVLGLCGVGFAFFLVTLGVLCMTTRSSDNTQETLQTRLSGLVSIIVSWLQVLSALTVTYNMAWPIHFATYSKGTGAVVNLDIMSLLAVGSCQLAMPFLNKFLLQMLTPPVFVAAVGLASGCVRCCDKKTSHRQAAEVRRARSEQAVQLAVVVIQLLYPKLATRTFQVFRCQDLGPRVGLLLENDFSLRCFEGRHSGFVWLAVVSAVLYLVGIPATTMAVLWRNRRRLHVPWLANRYGDLYRQVSQTCNV